MTTLHIDIRGQGLPLVLIHGWGSNSSIWEPLLPQLQKKYEVYSIDLPGFGKSPLVTKNYYLEEITRVILQRIPYSAIWCGWSLGGLISQWVAINHPAFVKQLITIASSPNFMGGENWPGILPQTLKKFFHLLKEDPQKTLLNFLELQLRGSPHQDVLFNFLKPKIFIENAGLQFALQGGLELLRDTDLRNDLEKISCPTLHIFGQHDMIVPMSVSKMAFDKIKNSKVAIIPRTGHLPFLTHPEVFLELVEGFIFTSQP